MPSLADDGWHGGSQGPASAPTGTGKPFPDAGAAIFLGPIAPGGVGTIAASAQFDFEALPVACTAPGLSIQAKGMAS